MIGEISYLSSTHTTRKGENVGSGEMTPIIEIQELTKQYGRANNPLIAVRNLNLKVSEGEIFAFVGPNGAGKTTTLRVMATLLQPTSGDIRVAGHSVCKSSREVRRVIGYMPDYFGTYHDMTVWEYLDFFAACYQIQPFHRQGLIDELLELVDLSHRREDLVESLSRGMKQRLSLARTIINDPRLLILDEPASGLDPRARVEIRSLLVELAHLGKTIFFSTHILADVAEICTRVAIIEAGVLVACGKLEELQQHLIPHHHIQVTLLDRQQEAAVILGNTPNVANLIIEIDTSSNDFRLEFDFSGDDQSLSHILTDLVQAGIPVIQFNSDNRDMEEVFMRATKGLVT
jgi:ABC-2 type transport system ATP-binding protein